MNLLFLCGCMEPQHEEEAAGWAKGMMDQAACLHQRRLLEGLRDQAVSMRTMSVRAVSAPFIGAWPTRSTLRVFRGFTRPGTGDITYVPFHNLWGFRSVSRAWALRKPLDRFLRETEGTVRAVAVYAPHTPFLYAAVRAKRMAPDLHLCLIVPDLPQYMNLDTANRRFYDFCKAFDIRLFERFNREVDSYLLLTREMAEPLRVGKRPFIVAEGISGSAAVQTPAARSQTFVYAGKLLRRFGVMRLLEAFAMLEDGAYRLVICGEGEMRPVVEEAARRDRRIRYEGLLDRPSLNRVLEGAGVLVNPRTNDGDYTRYSFPSKVIEYLQTGLPVAGGCLAGMPAIYRELLYCPEDDSAAALARAMETAMHADEQREAERRQKTRTYLLTLTPSAVAKRLVELMAGKTVMKC